MHVADTFDLVAPPVSDGRLQLGVWQGIFLLAPSPKAANLGCTPRRCTAIFSMTRL
jgi:hypothetical protein